MSNFLGCRTDGLGTMQVLVAKYLCRQRSSLGVKEESQGDWIAS